MDFSDHSRLEGAPSVGPTGPLDFSTGHLLVHLIKENLKKGHSSVHSPMSDSGRVLD